MRLSEVTDGIAKESIQGAHKVGLIDRQTSRRVVNGAGSFIDGMLGMVDDILGTSTKDVDRANVPLTCVGVKAELSVIDTQEHGPVILVQQIEEEDDSNSSQYTPCDNDDNGETNFFADCILRNEQTSSSSSKQTKAPLPSKIIPLYKTYNVSRSYSLFNDPTTTSGGSIKLYGRPASFLSNGDELLRFDTLGGAGGVKDAIFPIKSIPNKYCDEVIDQLRALVSWNRRRVGEDVKRGRVGVVGESANGGVIADQS